MLSSFAVASGWNESALITTYRQGLTPSLRLQLAAYDDPCSLEKFIQLSTRVSHCMQGCEESSQGQHSSASSCQPESFSSLEPEPMQFESTCLSLAERRRRLAQGLCLYGHVILECPICPPCPLVSFVQADCVSSSPLITKVFITVFDVSPHSLTLGQPGT